jgi:hypothetical protein
LPTILKIVNIFANNCQNRQYFCQQWSKSPIFLPTIVKIANILPKNGHHCPYLRQKWSQLPIFVPKYGQNRQCSSTYLQIGQQGQIFVKIGETNFMR